MCTGVEDNLIDCVRRDGWTHACYHVEDASVVCATDDDDTIEIEPKNTRGWFISQCNAPNESTKYIVART